MDDTPNPGTQDAIDAGCTCPVLDNSHGRGYFGKAGVYVFDGGCPVHVPTGDTEGAA